MKPINLLLLLLLLLLFFSGKIQAGSTEMIQKLLPTGKESNISLTEDVCPENSTVLWFDHLNRTMGTYYPDGETKVEPLFEGKVNITGPRTLTFLSPQTSDSSVYFAKVIGDQHKNTKISFNVTFQDQHTATTVAPFTVSPPTVTDTPFSPANVSSSTVSPTVSSAAIAVPIAVLIAVAIAVLIAVLIAVAVLAAIWLWRHQKKKSQDQKEVALFSANSGTNSPNVQIPLLPTQENGAPPESNHLMEENTGDPAA